jgi:hypothetical protein
MFVKYLIENLIFIKYFSSMQFPPFQHLKEKNVIIVKEN